MTFVKMDERIKLQYKNQTWSKFAFAGVVLSAFACLFAATGLTFLERPDSGSVFWGVIGSFGIFVCALSVYCAPDQQRLASRLQDLRVVVGSYILPEHVQPIANKLAADVWDLIMQKRQIEQACPIAEERSDEIEKKIEDLNRKIDICKCIFRYFIAECRGWGYKVNDQLKDYDPQHSKQLLNDGLEEGPVDTGDRPA